jgi:hypothetical protein
MKHLFTITLASFLLTSGSVALARNLTGVSKALHVIKIPRPDIESTRPDQPTTQECFVFPQFTAVQVDNGEKGAMSISIRPRLKSNPTAETCDPQAKSEDLEIPYNEQYVFGARGGFLFTESADLFGNSGSLWIYDTPSRKQLLEAVYDTTRAVKVSANDGRTALEFYQQLKVTCSLMENRKECWTKILKENEVPTSVHIKAPDCKDAMKSIDLKKYPSLLKNPGVVQIFAKVRVADIAKPKTEFLSGKSFCNATP